MMNKKLFQQAQKMQERLKAAQDEIEQSIVESSSGGGAVKIKLIGGKKVESVIIASEVVDPDDVEMLQDLIMSAVNEALESSQKDAAKTMNSATGGFNIPGLG